MTDGTPRTSVADCQTGILFTPWRLRVEGPASGEINMAADLRLLDQMAGDPGPWVRLYEWEEPTVSFGRTQDRTVAEAWARSLGAKSVVQRPTGGGMVFHDREMSVAMVWARQHQAFPRCLRTVYESIHGAVGRGLTLRGVDSGLYQPPDKGQRRPGVCFQEPVEGDLMWNGKKILGGALKITQTARLYQGDLQLDALSLSPEEGKKIVIQALTMLFGTDPASAPMTA